MAPEKFSVFGINYSSTNYEQASDLIISKAKNRISYTVSALAVHGLIESYKSPELKNNFRVSAHLESSLLPTLW